MSRCTVSPMGTPQARKNYWLGAVARPTAKFAPHAKSSALRPPRYGGTNGSPSASAAATPIPNLTIVR
uniref:Uncharacterized protein n=1 Tax=Arundo donax TaxID=35708 RepID=A0A0A9HIQ6_ARUDO